MESLTSSNKKERFETDAERIVHRHLQNKNDIITDDDIRNVRVGIVPGAEEEAVKSDIDESA